jgi:hypothetical protein
VLAIVPDRTRDDNTDLLLPLREISRITKYSFSTR